MYFKFNIPNNLIFHYIHQQFENLKFSELLLEINYEVIKFQETICFKYDINKHQNIDIINFSCFSSSLLL